MKRAQKRRDRLFWLLSILMIVSMIGGSLLVLCTGPQPTELPASSSMLPVAQAAGAQL